MGKQGRKLENPAGTSIPKIARGCGKNKIKKMKRMACSGPSFLTDFRPLSVIVKKHPFPPSLAS
jgi:hypothetical protein